MRNHDPCELKMFDEQIPSRKDKVGTVRSTLVSSGLFAAASLLLTGWEQKGNFTENLLPTLAIIALIVAVHCLVYPVGRKLISIAQGLCSWRKISTKTTNDLNQFAENLLKQKSILETVAQSVSEGVIASNNDGYVVYCNHRAKSLLGQELTKIQDILLYDGESRQPIGRDESPLIHAFDGKHVLKQLIVRNGNQCKNVLVSAFPVSFVKNRGAVMVLRDITPQLESEALKETLSSELQKSAFQAGRVQAANGVLHNVRNVLNSVNLSAYMIHKQVNSGSTDLLCRLADILAENKQDLASFFEQDPRGKQFPLVLNEIAKDMQRKREVQLDEIDSLMDNLAHVRDIVSSQQNSARPVAIAHQVDASELFEQALRINESSTVELGIRILRKFDEVSTVCIPKNQVLQILVNLVRNAQQAVETREKHDRLIGLSIWKEENMLKFEVVDNGVGISQTNLEKMFQHGFTTKKDGHGFGLHASAKTAEEFGGLLAVHSDGEGQGATFTLSVPLNHKYQARAMISEREGMLV